MVHRLADPFAVRVNSEDEVAPRRSGSNPCHVIRLT
jgi:hypothetical protein